jgi:hypothetical protein
MEPVAQRVRGHVVDQLGELRRSNPLPLRPRSLCLLSRQGTVTLGSFAVVGAIGCGVSSWCPVNHSGLAGVEGC